MNIHFKLSAIAVLLGATTIANAQLTTSTGAVNFTGSASVTATQNLPTQGPSFGTASLTNTNNGAPAANVAVNQFNGTTGVLTGVDLQLSSNRTQTISGTGYKNNGAGKTMSGSGTSDAMLSVSGASATFSPAIAITGNSCSLGAGGTGLINCAWGPKTDSASAANASVNVNSANLDDYVGGSTVSAALSLPSLSATTQQSEKAGQASGSTTTYKVDWSGTLQANYSYLLHAASSFNQSSAQNSLTLDFGTVAQNSNSVLLSFGVHNLADTNRAGLDLDSFTSSGDNAAFTTDLSSFFNLQQGNSQLFSASLLTSSLGAFSSQYVLNLSDADLGATSTRQNSQLTLNLVGNVAPVPLPAAVWLFGTGLFGFLWQDRRKTLARTIA